MRGQDIFLEKEERDFIYTQLSGRKKFFKDEMINAAKYNNTNDVIKYANTLQMIDNIMKKMLGV